MKRLMAAALWFYAFWYLGSMVAAFAGMPDIGPITGIAAGLIVGLDPKRVIWHPAATAQTQEPTPA